MSFENWNGLLLARFLWHLEFLQLKLLHHDHAQLQIQLDVSETPKIQHWWLNGMSQRKNKIPVKIAKHMVTMQQF